MTFYGIFGLKIYFELFLFHRFLHIIDDLIFQLTLFLHLIVIKSYAAFFSTFHFLSHIVCRIDRIGSAPAFWCHITDSCSQYHVEFWELLLLPQHKFFIDFFYFFNDPLIFILLMASCTKH